MINSCSFGFMVIDGRNYNSDLIIYPDGRIVDSWHRKKGHRLSTDDIRELIETDPDVIIAGTGTSGLVVPEKELKKLLSEKGIQFIHAPNQEAIELYNDFSLKKRVGACFHLTC